MPKKTIKAKKREVVNDAMIKKADKVFLGTEDLKKGEEVGYVAYRLIRKKGKVENQSGDPVAGGMMIQHMSIGDLMHAMDHFLDEMSGRGIPRPFIIAKLMSKNVKISMAKKTTKKKADRSTTKLTKAEIKRTHEMVDNVINEDSGCIIIVDDKMGKTMGYIRHSSPMDFMPNVISATGLSAVDITKILVMMKLTGDIE